MHLKNSKITKGAEYQRLSEGASRVVGKCFTILYKNSKQEEVNKFRFGITVSKKVGNAVKRNRYKRVIRVLVRDVCIKKKRYSSVSINVIARKFIVRESFSSIKSDFTFCLNKIFTHEKCHIKNS